MVKRQKRRTSRAVPRRRRSPSPRLRQRQGRESDKNARSSLGKTSVVVVMGVSGCGKSTIASMLAHRLNWIFEEGDWFHPQSNVEKMHTGSRSPTRIAGPGWRASPPGSTRLGAPATMAPSHARRSNAPIAISWSASAPTSASSISKAGFDCSASARDRREHREEARQGCGLVSAGNCGRRPALIAVTERFVKAK